MENDPNGLIWVLIIIVMIFSFIFYLIPSMIAFALRHPQRWIIFLINIFMGWTLIGWVVLFTWSIKSNILNANESPK